MIKTHNNSSVDEITASPLTTVIIPTVPHPSSNISTQIMTSSKSTINTTNTVMSRAPIQKRVSNGVRRDENGFVYVSVWGEAFERGRAYGELIREDMKEVMSTIEHITYEDYGVEWSLFEDACRKYYCDKIRDHFPEFYREMEGFAEGAQMEVVSVIAWNNYFTLTESWWGHMPDEDQAKVFGEAGRAASGTREGGGGGLRMRRGAQGQQERCTAFMVVGEDWTADGKIVMAHNNFSNYVDGQFANYVVDVQPDKGNRFLMISFAGWIWSGTDFFVTSAGMMGTETTIGGFTAYENNMPISCRIRNAMQYGGSLDDYKRMLLDGNSGDYANTWLIGDTNTNEIMRLELGLRFHSDVRTRNGCFISFNAPYDPRIRNLECANTGFDDVRRHQGARRVRLEQLTTHWKGKIDCDVAKTILADHYDVYLKKENPCSRTCCAHYDLDAREYMSDPSRPKPFQPRGALDGNVCDSRMAKAMQLCLRWGSSCGRAFNKNAFCDEHLEWAGLRPFLRDRPTQPWTVFGVFAHPRSHPHPSARANKRTRTRTRTRTRKNKRTSSASSVLKRKPRTSSVSVKRRNKKKRKHPSRTSFPSVYSNE
jgi:hypothetical protein